MSKADRFARRIDRHGQTVSLEAFSAYPTGDYVNSTWNAPDPNDADYPESGSIPGESFATAQSVKAMIQPGKGQGAERVVRTPWGDDVQYHKRAYFKGAQALTARDRVTFDGVVYWVAAIDPQLVGDETVYKLAYLVEEVE